MMLWARCSLFLEEVMWEYGNSFQGVFRALRPSVGCVGGPAQMLDGDEVGCSSYSCCLPLFRTQLCGWDLAS